MRGPVPMIPDDRAYTKNHEWVKPDTAFVELGLTDPLLRKLRPLVSIELPDADDELMVELPFGEVEGVQETYQLYPPAEARIIEVHAELVWDQKKLLTDPYGAGWLMKIRVYNPRQLDGLLNAESYREFCIEDLGEEFVGE